MSAVPGILLVGGSGFIGAHVARGLIARGHDVTVLARGRRRAVPGATMIAADRADPSAVAAALGDRRFALTVDFGAYDAPDLAWLAHVPTGAPGRIVIVSTGQVYLVGEGDRTVFREGDAGRPLAAPPAAGTPDHAQWSYGAGKRRAEAALRRLAERHGVPGVALRLPIVQGEADGSLRLWAWLERLLDGGPLVLPDGGRQRVRFLDAGDLAAVVARLAAGPAPEHDAYNLAQPDVVTLRDFLERAAGAAGVAARCVDVPWEACRDAGLEEEALPYAGRWVSLLDPARAGRELGFAGTPSGDYVPRVVRWHLEHRPGTSHPGYAGRARERELAERHGSAADRRA